MIFGFKNRYIEQARKASMRKKIDVQALENKTDDGAYQVGNYIQIYQSLAFDITLHQIQYCEITGTDCSCL